MCDVERNESIWLVWLCLFVPEYERIAYLDPCAVGCEYGAVGGGSPHVVQDKKSRARRSC